MEYTVEVSNLTKQFGNFTAVNDISFSVKKGEIFGFLGPNGAGKSTTIRMLCGILSPSKGSGTVSGFDIVNEQESIKSNIGYMSQKFSLYDDLTVLENLKFFGNVYGLDGKYLAERMDAVIEMSGIGERANSQVSLLPGGIKQRLALGTAILHDPAILFLDEPTSGVDPIMRRNFWDIIYRFSKEGKTIFVTTHYMDEVEHCDRIALIIAGKIIELDSPGNLKKSLPYDVYALRVQNFIEEFEYITSLDFVHEAAIFGSDIHVLTEKGYPLKKNFKEVLNKKKVNIFMLEKITPTLEDVFVTSARDYNK